jgi:hypothetical protein
MERLGITEKLSLLALACGGIIIESNNSLLVDVRELFDQRNALMHPKTKEFDPRRASDFVFKHPSEISIAATMQLLDQVLKGFCSLDGDVRKDTEFHKPDKTLKPIAATGAAPA